MADKTTETVNQQKQETTTKQKNPLRAEQGKRLVKYNHRKKQEVKNSNEQITKQDNIIEHKLGEPSNNYLYISGVSVVGLAIIRYFLYNKFKKQEQNLIDIPPPSNVSHANTKIELKRDIFEMYLKIYIHKVEKYTTDLKQSIYHGAVISALAIGFTMIGKSLTKMSPPSLEKFAVEDGVKLVSIVAISDFTKDYLIKQKIIPDTI